MSSRLFPLVAGLALLGGCEKAADAPTPAASTPAAPATDTPVLPAADAIVSPDRLIGEYRIAGVDDDALDLPYGVTASISATRIHVVADCINLAWDYRFEGAMLVTERAAVEGCGRGLTAQEQAIAAAFDAATSVAVNRANGIDFTGEGHTVTLFSQ